MQLFITPNIPAHPSGNYKETMIKVAHFTSRGTRAPLPPPRPAMRGGATRTPALHSVTFNLSSELILNPFRETSYANFVMVL